MSETEFPGLTSIPRREWPETLQVGEDQKVIEVLRPATTAHDRLLGQLRAKVEQSERAMSAFYARWRIAEKKVQAFIDLPNFEKEMKDLNDQGKVAKPVRLTVPYAFATISTIVAFLMQTFTSSRPMFQVGSNKQESINASRNMELTLQYNADHMRLIRQLYQFFTDGETYGLGILRVAWEDLEEMRTVRREVPIQGGTGFGAPQTEWQTSRELKKIYSGNDVTSQDPFMFFPDPRVPMADVARRGEYVFWRNFEGRHILKRMEDAGLLFWVDAAGEMLPKNFAGDDESSRALVSHGIATPGRDQFSTIGLQQRNFVQVDQGSVEIIPREMGLSSSERVEKWMFTMLNKKQIVQAERLEDDHGKHPIVVAEPYSIGYGFGHPSMADYLGPIQDIISWYVNSHIDNVRRTLNDIVVVDPSAIEMQDLKNPGPGAVFRLKRAAQGRNINTIIQQLPVTDVTSGHMKDAELMMLIGQRMSAITDQLTGTQPRAGNRETATSVRTRAEGAVSRLATHARLYSAMSLVDMTEMMSLNIQQYMDQDFYLELLGADGAKDPIVIRPELLVGDFHYPVHDGTMPIDKVALFEVWIQLFQSIQADEGLRQQYSIGRIFEHIGELGGARNIESFRINMQQDGEIEAAVQAGNMVPVGPGANGSGAGGPPVADIASLLG